MKKSFKITKKLGRRNVILSLVALILILLTFVSVSYSWIEEVSNVELNFNDDAQQTPLHISRDKLDSDITIQSNSQNPVVNLNSYFYRGGDMHLSSCYSDGVNFKFPLSGSSTTEFRDGTKDDANVNYLSATFRVTSSGAPTAYWFEKINSGNFFTTQNYTNATDPDTGERVVNPTTSYSYANVEKYLRVSVTVDGATSVYSFDNDGNYKYINSSNAVTSAGSDEKKAVRDFMYYAEAFNNSSPVGYYKNSANVTNKYNQGSGENLNGNTVFTVAKDKTSTVTVKIWLEKGASVNSIDLSNINLRLTSSWAKTRRIYLRDKTVNEWDDGLNQARGTQWLTTDPKARLYFAIYDNDTPANRTHYPIVKVSGNIYYVDIDTSTSGVQDMAAVYGGYTCAIYRCGDPGADANDLPSDYDPWNMGTSHNGDIKYWDKWETTIPNTYHSETYSIYSHEYGTWDIEDANVVHFVDSADFEFVASKPHAYLWDHNSEYDTDTGEAEVNKKVVKNADWPGAKMTKMGTTTNSKGIRIWDTFFASTYDRAVLNDGIGGTNDSKGLQTQDLWLSNSQYGQYFDMATLSWHNTKDYFTYTDCYVIGDFNQNNCWTTNNGVTYALENRMTKIRMAYNTNYKSSGSTWFICRVYLKSDGDYFFKIYDSAANKSWGRPSGWSQWGLGQFSNSFMVQIGTSTEQGKYIWLKDMTKGIYKIYFDYSSGKMEVWSDND